MVLQSVTTNPTDSEKSGMGTKLGQNLQWLLLSVYTVSFGLCCRVTKSILLALTELREPECLVNKTFSP